MSEEWTSKFHPKLGNAAFLLKKDQLQNGIKWVSRVIMPSQAFLQNIEFPPCLAPINPVLYDREKIQDDTHYRTLRCGCGAVCEAELCT